MTTRPVRRASAGLLAAAVLGGVALAGDPPASPPAAPPPAPAPEKPPLPDPSKAGPPVALSVDFEGVPEGLAVPEGLFPQGGSWTVGLEPEAKPPNHVLLQDRPVETWAACLVAGPGWAYADGKASVRFQPVSGRDDASGGIVFRAQDAKNYYLVRANALEDNFRLYVVKDGSRWQLATVTVDPPRLGSWHVLEVEFRGESFKATLDGKSAVEAQDKTFASGWCGLWTKGDSVTRFDDLRVEPAKPQEPAAPPAAR